MEKTIKYILVTKSNSDCFENLIYEYVGPNDDDCTKVKTLVKKLQYLPDDEEGFHKAGQTIYLSNDVDFWKDVTSIYDKLLKLQFMANRCNVGFVFPKFIDSIYVGPMKPKDYQLSVDLTIKLFLQGDYPKNLAYLNMLYIKLKKELIA